ncbi:MAG: hypothetical protein SFT91_01075 [Rickettsiaceae bacterium]|nr:hypothetical protein [Rickettsiaceae bacterium]
MDLVLHYLNFVSKIYYGGKLLGDLNDDDEAELTGQEYNHSKMMMEFSDCINSNK